MLRPEISETAMLNRRALEPASNQPAMSQRTTLMATTTLSFQEVLIKLESAKEEYKEFDEGRRKSLYQSMQRVAEAAVLVVADENIQARYRKKMGKKDALSAALTFIFDPKSTPEQKDASKKTSALWYMIVKLEVAVEDIAVAIPKHGGIEKLARLAAKSREDEVGEDQDEDEDDEDQKDKDQKDKHQDEPEEAEESDKAENKFGKLISVGLSPKLTTKLNQFADKTRIKIIGYFRTSPDESPTIEAKKIMEAPAKKQKAKSKTKAAKKKISKSKAKVSSKKRPDGDNESDWEE
jgi:hypothetical protein